MINPFASARDKANATLPESVSHLAVSVASLEAHDLTPPDPSNAQEVHTHRTKRQTLVEEVEIAEGVVHHWQQVVSKLEEEEAEKAADAEHAAMLQCQKVSAQRFNEVRKKIAALIPELEWDVSEKDAFDDYNARRGNRPYIVDPEQHAREIPGRTIPAVYEKRKVWMDEHGNQPTVLRTNAEGELEPASFHGCTQKVVVVCVSAERVISPKMPDRYSELLPALRKVLAK